MPGAIEELPLFGKRRSSLRRSARATVATADGKGKHKKQAATVTVWLYVIAQRCHANLFAYGCIVSTEHERTFCSPKYTFCTV